MLKKLFCILVPFMSVTSIASADPQSGHTDFFLWSFDWSVKDHSGLSIRGVSYNGERVIYKASMPVIRVGRVPNRKPSPRRAARRRATSVKPPNQIGICLGSGNRPAGNADFTSNWSTTQGNHAILRVFP